MRVEMNQSKWRVLGKTVRGASHKRARPPMPNQDAIAWCSDNKPDRPLIIAVSDGHGSAKHFRSSTGAQLAVKAAEATLGAMPAGQPDPQNLDAAWRWANESLPRVLVRHWANAVADHVSRKAFTRAERSRLEEEGIDKRRQVALNPVLAYGATVLSVAVTESVVVYLQLGDGDILTVSEAGEVSRPLPKDERLFGNETTSLCMPKAWCEIRMSFQVLGRHQPALIMLSTDGLANSFPTEEAFVKVGSDILDAIRSDGPDHVDENLESWLNEYSRRASGDDITLGILCRMDSTRAAAGSGVLKASEDYLEPAAAEQPKSASETEP